MVDYRLLLLAAVDYSPLTTTPGGEEFRRKKPWQTAHGPSGTAVACHVLCPRQLPLQ